MSDTGADRPLRVLYVITSLDRGGAQRQVVDLSARLVAAGWTVAVLSMIPPAHYVDELEAAGVRVAHLGMRPGRPTPGAFARYGRFVRRFRPDVIHGHMVHANLLVRLGRVFAPRTPVVCTVHNVNEGPRWREIAYRLTDRLASATTAVSAAATERYIAVKAAPAGRIQHVPNGFELDRPGDPAARARIRAELGLGEAFVWLTAGRLDVQKGQDLLIDAVAAIARERPEAILLIAGDGPEREALEARISGRGLAPTVRLLGDRPDVPALLAAADAFVLPSRWEGLPMVLLEAAAAGLPIVATDVGGNREIVRPEAGGILVDVEPDAISAGMRELMARSPGERATIGTSLGEIVRRGYDLGPVVARWQALYRRLSGPRQ